MDTSNGRIYSGPDVAAMSDAQRKALHLVPMRVPPTPFQRLLGKVGRNDLCPCGSGRKFKRCCLGKALD